MARKWNVARVEHEGGKFRLRIEEQGTGRGLNRGKSARRRGQSILGWEGGRRGKRKKQKQVADGEKAKIERRETGGFLLGSIKKGKSQKNYWVKQKDAGKGGKEKKANGAHLGSILTGKKLAGLLT